MAHVSQSSGYQRLVQRLNRFPQGAPPSQTLYRILKILFSEQDAARVALLPIKPFTVKTAARIWKVQEHEARTILDGLADRAILLDIEQDGQPTYVLPPPMAGFFEFSMMRLRGDIDQQLLAQLFHQYLNVEEDFIRALFGTGDTKLGRVFVNEPALTPELSLTVMDYERAGEVVRTAPFIGVGVCYCRHKMGHLGKACAAPLDICMTFNNTAASLIKHGVIRRIDTVEALDLLDQARGLNLVQFGDNVREYVNFICNCCGCCCEAMLAAQRFGFLHPVHTTNYLPTLQAETCTGCGKCAEICPVQAVGVVEAHDPRHPRRKVAHIDTAVCLGCGVCVRVCPQNCLRLTPRDKRVITPLDSTHRAVVMAIERGRLQDLIFDNQALWNHRAMAAVLGVILRLPPIKQALASRQVKSRYLEALIARMRP
ncbi:MAG: 4Fe-4S dicluster domain-containing protein [Syntrophaceae bacterium]